MKSAPKSEQQLFNKYSSLGWTKEIKSIRNENSQIKNRRLNITPDIRTTSDNKLSISKLEQTRDRRRSMIPKINEIGEQNEKQMTIVMNNMYKQQFNIKNVDLKMINEGDM